MNKSNSNYIDGFVHPIPRSHLDQYRKVAQKVADIWKEHGALSYHEYVGDDLELEGTLSFPKLIAANETEVILFGWVVFASREIRDQANKRVAEDPRMNDLIGPLTDPSNLIFDASRMGYGGFQLLV